jgi:hypothetical protein
MPSTAQPPPTAEPMIRLLRTVLDEARAVLQAAGPEEELLVLEQSIEQVQREAEALAPDFPCISIRNGPSPS